MRVLEFIQYHETGIFNQWFIGIKKNDYLTGLSAGAEQCISYTELEYTIANRAG